MASDESKKTISGLPPLRPTTDSVEETALANNIDKARECPQCHRPGRVVSNNCGINVHCGPCKTFWPVANSPLRPEVPGSPQRGLHKTTSVEPDWNIAFDRDVGDT
jgi:hypothetical protein